MRELKPLIFAIVFLNIAFFIWWLIPGKGYLSVSKITCTIASSFSENSKPPPIPALTSKNKGMISIWFDDGWKSQYQTAFPIMEKYQFKGAMAVVVNYVCLPAFMNWRQLHDLQNHGWEITSHSMTHPYDLAYYNDETTDYELLESKRILQKHGLRADNFVMPSGFSRSQIKRHFASKPPPIIKTAKKYYLSYRTTLDKRINTLPLLDPYNLKAFQIRNTTSDEEIDNMIRLAKAQKGWLIIVFHQIDDSKRAFSVSSSRFEAVLEKVKNSELPVVLPTQVLLKEDNNGR